MKGLLITLLILLTVETSAFAQNSSVKCNQGNQKEAVRNPKEHYGTGAEIVGQFSYDPNEIIGPTGFGDSIRWVSINDILNYTILFENDPEFATANAQKVDVRFNFDDKAYIKGFGLGTFGFLRTCN